MGSNITSVPTSAIQANLGVASDGKYGPNTTKAVTAFQGANGLQPDGVFGPKTLAAYNNKYNGGSAIVSTSDIHTQAKQDSADLDAALTKYNASYSAGMTGVGSTETDPSNPSDPTIAPVNPGAALSDTTSGTANDPIIQSLNNVAATSNDSTKALIANIQNTLRTQVNSTNDQYNNYKAGLKTLGIQTNAAEVTPDIVGGQINKASSDQMAKINSLQTAEVKALSDAETARANNDYKTLNEKMTYVKNLQTEKANALKEYQTGLANQNKEVQTKGDAQAKLVAPTLYPTLIGLDAGDQEKFLVAISQKLNIPLTSLTNGLVAEKASYDKEQLAAQKQAESEVLTPAEDKELGVPYGTTKDQAQKMGITPKTTTKGSTKGSGKSGTYSYTADDLDTYSNLIDNGGTDKTTGQKYTGIGTDGYADPGAVIAAMNDWVKNGGTMEDFASKFKVSKIINPASYGLLPAAIRPNLTKAEKAKIKTGSGSGSSRPS